MVMYPHGLRTQLPAPAPTNHHHVCGTRVEHAGALLGSACEGKLLWSGLCLGVSQGRWTCHREGPSE